jgi:hypothetical protein
MCYGEYSFSKIRWWCLPFYFQATGSTRPARFLGPPAGPERGVPMQLAPSSRRRPRSSRQRRRERSSPIPATTRHSRGAFPTRWQRSLGTTYSGSSQVSTPRKRGRSQFAVQTCTRVHRRTSIWHPAASTNPPAQIILTHLVILVVRGVAACTCKRTLSQGMCSTLRRPPHLAPVPWSCAGTNSPSTASTLSPTLPIDPSCSGTSPCKSKSHVLASYYTRYILVPCIHLYCRICTYVHPLYIQHICTSNTPYAPVYTPTAGTSASVATGSGTSPVTLRGLWWSEPRGRS